MRKNRFPKRILQPDCRYNSLLISQLINYTMRQGKKSLAAKLVYLALDEVEKKTKKNGLEVFQQAIKNCSPLMEVKSRRIGGATYQVPIEVKSDRKVTLALRWLLQASRSQQGKPFDKILAQEILNGYNNIGPAITRKENMHKTAQANKAFAHLARY